MIKIEADLLNHFSIETNENDKINLIIIICTLYNSYSHIYNKKKYSLCILQIQFVGKLRGPTMHSR